MSNVVLSVNDEGTFSNLPRLSQRSCRTRTQCRPSRCTGRNARWKKNPDRQIFFPDIFRVFYVDFIICVFPEAFADFQKKAKEAHASKYEAEVICRLTPSKWANTWGIECVDFKRSCCREVWNYIEFLSCATVSAIIFTWYIYILLDKFWCL